MSNVPDMPYGLRGCGACYNNQGRRGYRRTDLTRHLNLHFQRLPALSSGRTEPMLLHLPSARQ
jgi:hypothetical protein